MNEPSEELKLLANKYADEIDRPKNTRLLLIEVMKKENISLLEYSEGKFIRLLERNDVVTMPRVVTKEDIVSKYKEAGE